MGRMNPRKIARMNELWKPEVTVAAVVCHAGRYLLVEEETRDGLRLNQPAGHLEAGESLVAAVVRETLEEAAREFTPAALQGSYLCTSLSSKTGLPVTYLRFAFTGSIGEPLPGRTLDTGIVRTLWMSLEEARASAARHRSPLVLRCIEDHAAGKPGAPLELLFTDASVAAFAGGTAREGAAVATGHPTGRATDRAASTS